jgi:hypothetical protein
VNDRFRASVQYGDFRGSTAADRADKGGPDDWLRNKGLIQPGEFVLGIEIWAGENPGVHRDPISVQFLLVNGTFDSVNEQLKSERGPIRVTRVSADIGIAEFMGLFKRFSICLSPGGMLDERNYDYITR